MYSSIIKLYNCYIRHSPEISLGRRGDRKEAICLDVIKSMARPLVLLFVF